MSDNKILLLVMILGAVLSGTIAMLTSPMAAIFVSSPFLIIYILANKKKISKKRAIILGAICIILHGILIYPLVTGGPQDHRPQEFGVMGYLLVPFYYAIVAIPLELFISFVFKRSRPS
jgi:hypothetical protein